MARPRLATNLVGCFQSARVPTVDEIRRRLAVSRATAFRRLAEHGYFSSYNHRGRYLTIEEVACFDSRGLWAFADARFSRFGTLEGTVERLVTGSPSGMTHEELSETLDVRVHDPLLELVEEGAISRERLGPVFVYVSAAQQVRQAQLLARSSGPGEHPPRPTSRQVIAVLLDLIRDPDASRDQILSRCRGAGVAITPETVAAVFTQYDLEKKRAP